MAYADVGAELYDDPLIIVSSSSILFKSSQFNSFELLLLKKEQTIVSYENFNDFILPDIQSLFEKRINALSYNLAIGKNGKSIVKSLEDSTLNAATKQALFSDFITPFLTSLIFNPFRYAVQTNLAILQSVYFYQGILTNKELAERFQLPWKDILLLCWNWN
jgi:alanine dehydrogenase